MIVTPRDAIIADYSIKSYMKLYKKYYKQLPFTLYIYANTFTQELKNEYFDKWKKLPYVELYDNAEKKNKITKMGTEIISPEGVKFRLEGNRESGSVIWSEEILKFETPYWATVDADFEILNPRFIIRMINKLDNNDNLVAMSSDYTETKDYLGAYDLYERYHTWFCIYKKKAQICKVAHCWYEEKNENGRILVGYDDAAYFQKHLREDYGFDMDVVDPINQKQFIHYGAFSKNRLINKNNIKKFRKLAIASKIGGGCLLYVHLTGFVITLTEKYKSMLLKNLINILQIPLRTESMLITLLRIVTIQNMTNSGMQVTQKFKYV